MSVGDDLIILPGPKAPSQRQRVILGLLARGHTRDEAAEIIGRTRDLIRDRVSDMERDWKVHSQQEVLVVALECGWVKLEVRE